MANVGAALKFGVAPPAARGATDSSVNTGWTDWAYSNEGKGYFEKTEPAQWEKNYMQDEWIGSPNKLMATTLNTPATVPNDSNLGVITPGISAKTEKYNTLLAAYNK